MQQAIRIIGIDPGLRRTGWGVVESRGNALSFVAAGTVRSDDKGTLAARLCEIFDGLHAILAEHAPQEAAVEQTFVNKDAAATLKLGQARGIAMLVPARAGLVVGAYSAGADKAQRVAEAFNDAPAGAPQPRIDTDNANRFPHARSLPPADSDVREM